MAYCASSRPPCCCQIQPRTSLHLAAAGRWYAMPCSRLPQGVQIYPLDPLLLTHSCNGHGAGIHPLISRPTHQTPAQPATPSQRMAHTLLMLMPASGACELTTTASKHRSDPKLLGACPQHHIGQGKNSAPCVSLHMQNPLLRVAATNMVCTLPNPAIPAHAYPPPQDPF
jgi:hypothetical protein